MPGPCSKPKKGKTALNRERGTLDRWNRNRVQRANDNRKPPANRGK